MLLVAAVAGFFTIIVFINISDYQTNWELVKLVLGMTKINHSPDIIWHAITNEALQRLIYGAIIAYEAIVAIVCWWGVYTIYRKKSYKVASIGIGMGVLLYFFGFGVVAGEWFAVWQYRKSVQYTAYLLSILLLLIMLFINQNEKT